MDNPDKPATQGTQDEDEQSKNTTQYVLDTAMRKQTQLTEIRHEPSYKYTFLQKNDYDVRFWNQSR